MSLLQENVYFSYRKVNKNAYFTLFEVNKNVNLVIFNMSKIACCCGATVCWLISLVSKARAGRPKDEDHLLSLCDGVIFLRQRLSIKVSMIVNSLGALFICWKIVVTTIATDKQSLCLLLYPLYIPWLSYAYPSVRFR